MIPPPLTLEQRARVEKMVQVLGSSAAERDGVLWLLREHDENSAALAAALARLDALGSVLISPIEAHAMSDQRAARLRGLAAAFTATSTLTAVERGDLFAGADALDRLKSLDADHALLKGAMDAPIGNR